MKKLINSTPAKIAAFMLSLVMVIVFFFSAFTTLLMVNYQFYFSDEKTVKTEILTDMAYREGEYICNRLEMGLSLADYYKNKNIYYKVSDIIDGDILQSNYNGEEYIVSAVIENYIYRQNETKIKENGSEHIIYGDRHVTNINVYIAEDMRYNDIFSLVSNIVHIGFKLQYFMIIIAIISLALAIALISYLFCAAGHTATGGVSLNYLDKIPLDIYACFITVVALLYVVIFGEMSYNQVTVIAFLCILACIGYCVVLGFALSIATRIKTGTLFKNTVIYRVLRGLKNTFKKPLKYLRYTLSNLSLVKKTLLILGFSFGVELIILSLLYNYCRYNGSSAAILPLLTINLIVFAIILYFSVTLQKINQGGEEIKYGNLDHKIDTRYMIGDFKNFAENMNNINSSLQVSLDERMKSEHFKVELITNVSHDIKTPLTSIINYVDLIKKEKIENKQVNEYIEVLDRQSGRLKKLVEDLVEASKASSGNLTVNLETCDIGVLLNQTIGEFEERLEKAELTPIIKIMGENINVLADGRHLWRVFDNLLSNVCKYAMPKTRVYITVTDNSKRTEIIFRNISKYELNITAEELMERFVRGDKARNTEGHGLGLSIARSLLELQGGQLEVSVDGDLFKATVVFEK